jgi:predicted nucleic acid-binding protein
VSAVVIDASAGTEILAGTRRGQAHARLVPTEVEGWVPEHFYAEVLAVLRRQSLVRGLITEAQATAAVSSLGGWSLHWASLASLVDAAWVYRHHMTAPDAFYVALPERLDADFLTDDHNLVDAATFPRRVNVLRLGARP